MGRCWKIHFFPCGNFIVVENFPEKKKQIPSYVIFVTTKGPLYAKFRNNRFEVSCPCSKYVTLMLLKVLLTFYCHIG